MKALIDTNVLLDVIARRAPFFNDSAMVWTMAEQGRIHGLVSAISLTNIYYIGRKLNGRDAAIKALTLIRDSFAIVECDAQILGQAIDAVMRGESKDVEDAVQFFSAARAGAQCLVTRNPGDFAQNFCPVVSPTEFLARFAPPVAG
ncbi:MAG: PIN domain-containing protein [Planctomycetes bacterium]|nr:PIN domain-containing protein [Planctomycetota bacterium]